MQINRWLIGYIGTWLVLALMADINDTGDLAAALAVSIAVGATFVMGRDAANNIFAGA